MAPVATPVRAASGEGLVCALTFDDGPNGKDTAALLDFLSTRGIRAVFAVIGEQIQALGDPEAPVPFWRAPNGRWGVTAEVAVQLGMQPLDVVNVIEDWIDQDTDLLADRLRAVMTLGELVLVHGGGGDRAGSVSAAIRVVDERRAEGGSFTLPIGAE